MNPEGHQEDFSLPVAERIAYLIVGFLRKTLTEEEHDELDAWVVASEDNTRLFEELTDESNIEAALAWHEKLNTQKALQKIKEQTGLRPKRTPFLRSLWAYAITACLLVAMGAAIWYFRAQPVSHPAVATPLPKNVIQPGADHAVLTLAGGRTIILDASGEGYLAKEGGIQIEKGEGGTLRYTGSDSAQLMNQLSIPRGGQYQVTLSDGTKVWLNAQSTLRYPAAFSATHRAVELEGEGYFEVAKNPSRPFQVHVLTSTGEGGTIEVLGTHFNINGYQDERAVTTTLLEGSVRVDKGTHHQILKPGEQARIKENIEVRPVDVQKEIAWKEGLFLFQDASLPVIAGQLSRWYDIDIEEKGRIPYHFNATISRNEPLSEILEVLEATGRVHFHLEGSKLIIQP